MRRMVFAAAALSLALAGPAFAQGSNTGEPNTLHGSGDMMQDGPHASANPVPASPSSLPSGRTQSDKEAACDAKWKEAVAGSTTGGRSEHDFKAECRRAL
ncbi:MAG TPA: hypothetical protein VG889_06100 [Rhizomicrobium sp.]|nr:hypothetical protein [Rhizomicrobium sp.]